ncbi:hypothetical protein BJ741DRAFT_577030 [Chytriomyces cf. hyalinus JEL632]|nr:hypothetical protein BJ741DRAFT_577030 [Chytriomyces cf. hyalinus JEL632]
MGKVETTQARRDQRKVLRMNPTQPANCNPLHSTAAPISPSHSSADGPVASHAPGSAGRIGETQSGQATVVPVSAMIQSRVHQIMGSHLGLAMTPQQLLAHVYGCADSELAVLSAEQKQVLNFITHLQMVKVHNMQTQSASHAPPVLRLNTANLNKYSNTMATPLTPTIAPAASLASAPILPTSIPSPSQAANNNNPLSLPTNTSDLQQHPPILASNLNQSSTRIHPVSAPSQHCTDDLLQFLSGDSQSHRQFQPPQQQFQQRHQQPIHAMAAPNSMRTSTIPQQSFEQFSYPHQRQLLDHTLHSKPQYFPQQQPIQQQPQSGMEQELSQMRIQMTQMQKYISHLVQNQSQMNGQISQLFSQLLKVTTSPCPISPPSLQSATPIDMTKSPTHDESIAHGNVSSFQDAAFAANVLNASTMQPLVNDFSFDESFEQLFGDAL